jgi:hypothetical protein
MSLGMEWKNDETLYDTVESTNKVTIHEVKFQLINKTQLSTKSKTGAMRNMEKCSSRAQPQEGDSEGDHTETMSIKSISQYKTN